MTTTRSSLYPAMVAIALSVPLVGASQTAAPVTLPTSLAKQTVPALPPTSPDATTRLDGRLFFSPQQRQRIDEARKRGVAPGADTQLEDGQPVEPQPPVLNGFVKRSDGNTAVWVDGVSRWNANSSSANNLSPSDVGGPANYLKSTSGEIAAPAIKHRARIKKPVKPRVKKIAKLRRLR